MVSLSRSTNTNSGGATFFSESVAMDEREYLQPILESYGIFKPLKTTLLFTLYLVATLSINVAAIVIAICHPNELYRCKEYYLLLYARVALWFLALLLDQVLIVRHYNLRMNGYLEFYKKTQIHHRAPFYIVSLWNTTVLLVETIMQHLYSSNFEDRCVKGGMLSPVTYLCAFLTIESILLTVVGCNYIVKVHTFNKIKSPPDVQREEWNACSSAETFAQGEIGYRQLGDKVYDFIEKQADMIRHLKDHNARLSEKLMIINAQLHARTRSGVGN